MPVLYDCFRLLQVDQTVLELVRNKLVTCV